MTTTYNIAGHACPITGRLAMTVAEAYAREDMPDRVFWLYSEFAAESGLDAWSLLDGMDATVALGDDGRPVNYTLDFANGRRVAKIAPARVVYMQRTKAEREPHAPLLWLVELMRLVPVGAREFPARITMESIAAPDHEAAAASALALMAAPGEWLAVRADSRRA